jgi:membrane protease YdiL (CAAX protease family)
MATTTVRFLSVLFAALALAPALAHLFELPNKMGLSRDEYLTVQQIYSGWALLGFVVWAALLSSLALTLLVRKRRREFVPALIGFLCIAGTQVVFWTLTFPTNELTANWTVLPDNWAALRLQWEYSHAASAVLNLIALVAIIASVLARDDSRG